MPAWLHSEWRLLHAYVPACSGPAKASLSGKRDFKTRDEGTETASLIQFLLCRDRALARNPRQLGGLDPVGSTPEAFAQQLRAEEEKWAKVIRAGNIKAPQ
jgi:hypothetical protein